jgi:hypothetical protein
MQDAGASRSVVYGLGWSWWALYAEAAGALALLLWAYRLSAFAAFAFAYLLYGDLRGHAGERDLLRGYSDATWGRLTPIMWSRSTSLTSSSSVQPSVSAGLSGSTM